jgi:MoaA/NifB/PqqE/SkfB family radical SAM enzyme
MTDPYSTQKICYHPEAVDALVEGRSHELQPILLQLMPENRCNHNCQYCSYRLEGWKNSEAFDHNSELSEVVVGRLMLDCSEMGVKALELTGGGEPTLYPHFRRIVDGCIAADMDLALVTNGIPFVERKLYEPMSDARVLWFRVSIDAGTQETYCKLRKCPPRDWKDAWSAIRYAKESFKGAVIGVSFVLNDVNCLETYGACQRAKDSGADNIRLSVAFTQYGTDIIPVEKRYGAMRQVFKAQSLADDNFKVVDLVAERLENLSTCQEPKHPFCGSKDIITLVEGAGNVYTCCSHAGSGNCVMGNINEERFREIWARNSSWRRSFDATRMCKVPCLYTSRNATMQAIRNGVIPTVGEEPAHVNFV